MEKKDIQDTKLWSAPRHPDFDSAWEQWGRMVWWWGGRIARAWNRSIENWPAGKPRRYRRRWCAGDFVGWLTVRLNYCLYFREEGKNLGTLFSLHLYGDAVRNCLKYDSESLSYAHWSRYRDEEDTRVESCSKEFYENDYFLYRVPERESWAEEMVDLLGQGNPADAWSKITEGLDDRAKTVMEMRYKHDATLKAIGEQFGITKERVRQIQDKTLSTLRHRLERLEPVRRLFYGD